MKLFPVLLLLLLQWNSLTIVAQVVVERSDQRVVIEGKTYYLHTVSRGETLFSISRAYSVSVEIIQRENPDAAEVLSVGQVLRIPYAEPEEEQERDHRRFIYHTIIAGETLFSLSRQYDVSVSAILEVNPGIDPSDIPVGYELAIPRKTPLTEDEPEEVEHTDDQYTTYRVERGETLSSISRKFGVSVREIRRANRGLLFPRANQIIMIPGRFEDVEDAVDDIAVADTAAVIDRFEPDTLLAGEEPEEFFTPEGVTDISMLQGRVDIAVMLPLNLDENSLRVVIDSSRTPPRVRERPFQWIAPGTTRFIEMYNGVLIAASELRDAGLDVTVHLFETGTGSDAEEIIDDIIGSGRLRNMDLIIGPVHSFNLERVAPYAARHNIPIVSPVPLRDYSVLNDNPTLFMANPSMPVLHKALANAVARHHGSNLLFIYTDTARVYNEAMDFRDAILNEVTSTTPPENLSFNEILFRSRAVAPLDGPDRLDDVLSQSRHNVVILGTEDGPAIKETLMDLSSLRRHYPVTVYGFPAVRELEMSPDLSYLFDLEVELYDPFYIDYSSDRVQCFLDRYRALFYTEPAQDSFAWVCYDITIYFVSGLSMHGGRFLSQPGIHNPLLLTSRFSFRRDGSQNGFENMGLTRLKYRSATLDVAVEERRERRITGREGQ